MTTTEDRTGLGAIERDYNEIHSACSAAGGRDLADKFESMMCDIANVTAAREVSVALRGASIRGLVDIGDWDVDVDLKVAATSELNPSFDKCRCYVANARAKR